MAAEFKRASPSKGDIATDLDAAEQAMVYASAGAAVISVLTEPAWFKGSLEDMERVRRRVAATPNRPAVLRKDFLVDPYQVVEARAHGADSVLIIVAIMDGPAQLGSLIRASREEGMEPLVEVASEEEMALALDAGARVIGVNNRDLHTFRLDMERTPRLCRMATHRGVPLDGSGDRGVLVLALSGVRTHADVAAFAAAGAKGVLVGETLMRAADPAAQVRLLLRDTPAASAPLVKICGVKDAATALAAARAGCDMVGLMFVPSSRRCVTLGEARDIAAAVHGFREDGGATAAVVLPDRSAAATASAWFSSTAAALRAACARSRPLLVGVFQNQDPAFVRDCAAAAGLDAVQLHGDETEEYAGALGVPALRVVHVPEGGSVTPAGLDHGRSVGLLLDTALPGARGGTGRSFDWPAAARFAEAGIPVLIAGGLRPDNVAEAVRAGRPLGVDVSGGVEADGAKDAAKIRAFVDAAKSAVQ